MTRRFIAVLLALVCTVPSAVSAQPAAAPVWRTLAEKLPAGSDVVVRLQNGQRFRATLIEARVDALLVQPRTRKTVPVQPVSYDAIASLERYENRGSLARAVAIGAAVGAGTFLAIVAIIAASLD